MNFLRFQKKFPTEQTIVDYYIVTRYSKELPHCNHCGSEKVYPYSNERFKHQVVNHSKGEYKKGVDAHTNSIEGFWSTLKRGVYGIYHHVSKKHLQHYVNEFAFRYNNRNNEFIFDKLVGATIL